MVKFLYLRSKGSERSTSLIIDKIENEDEHGFFIVDRTKASTKTKQIYGTVFLYNFYYNYHNNLWLICNVCNNKKTCKDTIEWLENNGHKEFLENNKVEDNIDSVLKKIMQNFQVCNLRSK